MMIAMKKTKSHVQALPGMAKDEAKFADAVDAGTLRPSPQGDGLARSPSQESAGGGWSYFRRPHPLDPERYPAP